MCSLEFIDFFSQKKELLRDKKNVLIKWGYKWYPVYVEAPLIPERLRGS